MRSPALCSFSLVLLASSCGGGFQGPPSRESPLVAGEACDSQTCGSGFCNSDYPGGVCTKVCESSSQCGSNGICIDFSNSDVNLCLEACTPGSNTCRPGYSCAATTNTAEGFCYPTAWQKAPTGAACENNSDCATNVCSVWPGGYCTKGCNTRSDCASTAVCVRDAIVDGVNACLARCSAPGARSSCRTGYTCVGLKDENFGVCMPVTTGGAGGGGGGTSGSGGGAAGGAGGGGGGAGGSSGGAGGAGGAGGGVPAGPCRTYATAYTEKRVAASGTTFIQHTVTFDRALLRRVDTSSEMTLVEQYATLGDFVNLADPGVYLRRGGPSSQKTTTQHGSFEQVFRYDAQGRLKTVVANVTTSQGTSLAMEADYFEWDTYGRPKGASLTLHTPFPGEKCVGQALGITYDNATRMTVNYFSGGTSQSMIGRNNCQPKRLTDWYDSRVILSRTMSEIEAHTSTSDFTVTATAIVCL